MFNITLLLGHLHGMHLIVPREIRPFSDLFYECIALSAGIHPRFNEHAPTLSLDIIHLPSAVVLIVSIRPLVTVCLLCTGEFIHPQAYVDNYQLSLYLANHFCRLYRPYHVSFSCYYNLLNLL